ncbi:hypothetical protein F511_12603 [Dorcoceras hygrometricum]|uniref:Uncharacterized protein n=1 Tax=Dorcoceras hygrometricum TaxID=472368 RepID=A0A2Z7C4D7_9LAMI|nr:hypothetical protein F511_12603 [Dorcoceras hygrometricum]
MPGTPLVSTPKAQTDGKVEGKWTALRGRNLGLCVSFSEKIVYVCGYSGGMLGRFGHLKLLSLPHFKLSN